MPSTALVPASVVVPAAEPIAGIVRTLDPALLTAPTPCAAYDVRGLLQHLLFWGPVLEAAGRKEPTAPPAAAETDLDLVVGDWPAALDALLGRMVTAWSDPAAWEGATSMGGPTPMPAAMVGGMVVGELVVHGWDLGRALGLRPAWDEDVLAFVYRAVVATAVMGREMGVYGPEVAVPGPAPTLDRLLGVTGRNPDWAP
jgi:uncharacterized protein (TIGR03086 family)